jgi:hypothetical protein
MDVDLPVFKIDSNTDSDGANTDSDNGDEIVGNKDENDSEKYSAFVKEISEEGNLDKTCYAIGKFLANDVYEDSKRVHLEASKLESLCTFMECNKFLKERPTPLLNFLLGLTGIDDIDNKYNISKLLPLSVGVEQIYKARNKNFIGPLSFGNGVVKWSMCGSKTAHALDGAASASGGVTTLKSFLKDSSTEANTCYSKDVDVFSDNTQRTGKTVRVRENGTTPVGVATNVVFIQQNPPSDIQSHPGLKPCNWPEQTLEKTLESINELETDLILQAIPTSLSR